MVNTTSLKHLPGQRFNITSPEMQVPCTDQERENAGARSNLANLLILFMFIYVLFSGVVLGSFYWQFKPVTSAAPAAFTICRGK